MSELILPEESQLVVPSARQLAVELDLSMLVVPDEANFLAPVEQRAEARVFKYQPITPEDRLKAVAAVGFHPHGLYLPEDLTLQESVRARLRALGEIPDPGQRLQEYAQFQQETLAWAEAGQPGRWTGQQGLLRSKARFRLAAWGRRGGKTEDAAAEGVGIALTRARSTVWVCASIMKLVSRCFDRIIQYVQDLNLPVQTIRNSSDEKLIVLANGSRIEGISLDVPKNSAGAAVDFAIIDEAAQISADAWYRAVLPPLSDRQGQALLISSWEGQDSFFYRLAEKVREEAPDEWEIFVEPSWDVNFYMFPQGRKSPAIVQEERGMPPEDFLEQFGAVPMRPRDLIFPQFRHLVHVEACPYIPGLPVTVCADPSGGANAYALLAVQEFDDTIRVFDEYYQVGAMAEDAIAELNLREWRKDVVDGIMDSALPTEIRRWQAAGWPMRAVPRKPSPEVRFPFYRRLLRDPVRYFGFYMQKRNQLLLDMGLDPEHYESLPPEDQRRVAMEIEESMADARISPEDVRALKRCAYFRFDPRCKHTIQEHKTYVYRKPRTSNTDLTEAPKKFDDHALDALGYWVWTFKRFSIQPEDLPVTYNYLQTGTPAGPSFGDSQLHFPVPVEQGGPELPPVGTRLPSIVGSMRERFNSSSSNYLRRV